MRTNPSNSASETTDLSLMSPAELVLQVRAQAQTITSLERQLEWYRRQVFGAKSERFIAEPNPQQLHLGEAFAIPSQQPEQAQKVIAAHTRRAAKKDGAECAEELPFFDESKVPVQTIVLMPEDVRGLSPDQYEIIGEKVTYRLAQRPGSYEVLKYRRPVVKLKGREEILTVAAPAPVFEGSRADVSLVAGVLMDKFAWHLPLYRQHQRMEAAGLRITRPWLTQITQRAIQLLTPIYEAQLESIRASRVLAMDETPIKAGRSGHGKMHTGYFWPIYGERDEVCFPFHPSRKSGFVSQALGLSKSKDSVLLSDGYAAYASYAKKTGLTHAQCWSHCRREFFEALTLEPLLAGEALERIQALYAVEDQIRELQLTGEAKQIHRLTHAKPIVEEFFDWLDRQLRREGLTPSNPFVQALAYARKRRSGLEVFLTDPDVPIDTNHLERALRVIPMGRKSWLFCWTELGAKHVGIIQSLITTCRLHDIDAYTYLVDVLQRVGDHPASRVAELTPRLWKQYFADQPLRSDIYDFPR